MPGKTGTFPFRKRCQSGPFFGSGPPQAAVNKKPIQGHVLPEQMFDSSPSKIVIPKENMSAFGKFE